MAVKKSFVEDLFNNLNDGEFLGFWRSAPISYIIKFFQKLDKTGGFQLNRINHVGVVYDVKRSIEGENEVLSFMLSHQTGSHGGKYDEWKIVKTKIHNNQTEYFLFRKTKYKKLYWLELDAPFTEKEKERGQRDAILQQGKKYGYKTFIFGIPQISAFLGKIFNPKLFNHSEIKRKCSKHNLMNHKIAGRKGLAEILAKNPFPTPEFCFTVQKDDLKGTVHEIIDFKDIL